jgi:adenylate kinase family enzyme
LDGVFPSSLIHEEVASRILIYGVTGSGKTTLAARLNDATGIPWFPVDDLTFEPNWVAVPNEIQRERFQAICDQDAWILDSAYGSWLEVALSRADLIIGLDYPRWLSLGRLVRRTFKRVFKGDLVCNGNRESLRMSLSKQSIIIWHFKSFSRKRKRMRKWAADPTGPRVRLFRSPREVNSWLAGLNSHSTDR